MAYHSPVTGTEIATTELVSVVNRASEINSCFNETLSTLNGIADRVFGGAPSDAGKSVPKAVRPGSIGAISDTLDLLNETSKFFAATVGRLSNL